MIVRGGLGDAEEAEFAARFFLQQRGHDLGYDEIVGSRRHGVQLEHIDVIDAQTPERSVQAFQDFFDGKCGIASGLGYLGADDHAIAVNARQRLAGDILGAIDSGGVDQVYAEIECLTNNADGIGLGLAGAQAQAAEAAAAKARDADFKACAAKRGVLHARSITGPRR